MPRKNNEFSVTSPDGKDVRHHTYGQVFQPEDWEAFKAFQHLSNKWNCEPATLALSMTGLTSEQTHLKWITAIPLVLAWVADLKEVAPTIQSASFILACYWHFRGNGPRPGLRKVKYRKVSEDELFSDTLKCPVCNKIYSYKKEEFTDKSGNLLRTALMQAYGDWMVQHAINCQRKLSKKSVLQSLRAEREKNALEARKAGEYFTALMSVGNVGKEIVSYLMSLRAANDALTRELENSNLNKDAIKSIKEKYEQKMQVLKNQPLDLQERMGLTMNEKIELSLLMKKYADELIVLHSSENKTQFRKQRSVVLKLRKQIDAYQKKGGKEVEPLELAPVPIEFSGHNYKPTPSPSRDLTLERALEIKNMLEAELNKVGIKRAYQKTLKRNLQSVENVISRRIKLVEPKEE